MAFGFQFLVILELWQGMIYLLPQVLLPELSLSYLSLQPLVCLYLQSPIFIPPPIHLNFLLCYLKSQASMNQFSTMDYALSIQPMLVHSILDPSCVHLVPLPIELTLHFFIASLLSSS